MNGWMNHPAVCHTLSSIGLGTQRHSAPSCGTIRFSIMHHVWRPQPPQVHLILTLLALGCGVVPNSYGTLGASEGVRQFAHACTASEAKSFTQLNQDKVCAAPSARKCSASDTVPCNLLDTPPLLHFHLSSRSLRLLPGRARLARSAPRKAQPVVRLTQWPSGRVRGLG